MRRTGGIPTGLAAPPAARPLPSRCPALTGGALHAARMGSGRRLREEEAALSGRRGPRSRPLPAAAARSVPPPPARTWVGAGGHMTRCAAIG